MAEVVDDVPARALAIYAHPDDPEVSCGGTLARWTAAGCEAVVVVCAQGDKGSSDGAMDAETLAALRAGEVGAAAAALGLAGHHLLGHPDGEVDNDVRLRSELVGLVREHRPDVVVCPDPTAVFFGTTYFNHRDHREVGWAALDAVWPAASMPLYFPAAGPPHEVAEVWLSGTLEPDVWVDISGSVDAKTAALMCHTSQLGETGEWFRQVVRQRAEEGGRSAGVRYAEGFRRLRVRG